LGGVANWNGKAKWYEGSIRKMLTNEKYKGDVLLQKTYTVDFLSKKWADNNGQVRQYYVEDSHPAIIDKEIWEEVQLEMERRRNFVLKYGIQKLDYATISNPFTGRVICGTCGRIFGRKVWNSTDERLRRYIWQCNGKYPWKGKKGCANRHIDDGVLYQAFINVFNMMLENKNYFLGKWKEMRESDNALVQYKAKQFAKIITEIGRIKEFDVELYFALTEKVFVYDGGRLMVVLLDGTEVEYAVQNYGKNYLS